MFLWMDNVSMKRPYSLLRSIKCLGGRTDVSDLQRTGNIALFSKWTKRKILFLFIAGSPFQNGDGEVCTSRASSIAPPGFKFYEIFTQCVFVYLSTSLFELSTMYLLTISKRELNPQYLCLLEVPTWLEYNSTSILNWLPLPTVPCFFSPQNSNMTLLCLNLALFFARFSSFVGSLYSELGCEE